MERLGLGPDVCLERNSRLVSRNDLPDQNDSSQWPRMMALFAHTIKARTLGEWTDIFAGAEACVTPVLELEEAISPSPECGAGNLG